MAAGLGFKTFATGDVLSAADVNGYLMQGVLVFASAAARDAAITSPQEGQACYLKDTNATQTYSGSAWVAVGGAGSPLTTKGDVYTYSTADARLAVGANDTVLTADSSTATGLKWAAPAGGGGMTSIASGSLTGATVSLTSIAGTYKNLILVIRDYYFAGAFNFRSQLNSNSGSVYWNALRTNDHTNATVVDAAGFQTSLLRLSGSSIVNNADNNNVTVMQINDYANATSNKLIQVQSAFIDNGTNRINVTNNAVFNDTTAITSIQIYSDGSTFSGGTYVLYGVS